MNIFKNFEKLSSKNLKGVKFYDLAKNFKFFPLPSHLAPSFGATPFEFMENVYGSWN